MGLLTKNKNMPYGPTRKIKICPMGLFIKKIYALWAYSQRIKICLMGLLTKNKNMPYGPTRKQQIYALWAYSQNKNIPYGPTHKENICLMEPTHKE